MALHVRDEPKNHVQSLQCVLFCSVQCSKFKFMFLCVWQLTQAIFWMPPKADVMALPIDPRLWTDDQVQQWFREYKGGKWARFGPNFSELSGDELCDLTETQILRFFDNDPRGSVVYNLFAKQQPQGEHPAMRPAMATGLCPETAPVHTD